MTGKLSNPMQALRSARLTTVIATLAILATTGGAFGWLCFDRAAIEAGQVWRLFTGHLVHLPGDHLFWDVLAWLVLGAMAERVNRSRMVACTVGSMLAISAAVWWFEPTVGIYCGLSGVDTALFVLVGLTSLVGWWREGNRAAAAFAAMALVGLMGKVGFEFVTGQTLFAGVDAGSFKVVPLAHVAGAAVGLLLAVLPRSAVSLVESKPSREPIGTGATS